MNSLYNFMVAHPGVFLSIWTTVCGCFSAFVNSLRAPTKDSSQWYVSVFAVLNFLSFNFSRMNPQVEKSPNFQAAVEKQGGNNA